jgi:DNA-nicking Smr family endonuclease
MVRATKAQREALLQELHRRRDQPDVAAFLDLLGVMLDECKNALVTCPAEEFLAMQGEAQAYDRLIKLVARPPSNSRG